MSWIKAVGIGPGNIDDMTYRAREALKKCDVIVGYKTYIDLVEEIVVEKEIISSGMRSEVDRCNTALEVARKGKKVCVISSGDAGIYGMAGLLLELNTKEPIVDIEVIPGISAVNSVAAILGAPLMNDFAVISLSDYLTPWETIEKRLKMAAKGDFVIALYNPKSKTRKTHINKAREIILESRSKSTPVGIVKNASREGEQRVVTTLGDMLKHKIDMTTLVIIGNSKTFVSNGKMITPRGYKI